ncbi:hypothetical protein [Pseudomonas defluvii]|uniref:hypothetical protein n=1 Tax=Pseudomonas defluvii TaxID=1876757 RepID=UPI0039065BD2
MSENNEVLSIDSAAVVENSLVAFGAGMSLQSRNDAKNAYLFASLATNKLYDPTTQGEAWFNQFLKVMQDCGWVTAHRTYEKEASSNQSLKLSNVVVKAVQAAAATALPGTAATAVLGDLARKAIGGLPKSDQALALFKRNVDPKSSAVVGVASCIETADGEVVMALGAVQRRSSTHDVDVLFFDWDSASSETYKGTAALSFNKMIYDRLRARIEQQLGDRALSKILDYEI